MRRMIVVMAACVLSLVSMGLPISNAEVVTERPITDWFEAPPSPILECPNMAPYDQGRSGGWLGQGWSAFLDHSSTSVFVRPLKYVGDVTPSDDLSQIAVYDGSIVERTLPTGRVEVTVTIQVWNESITVFDLEEWFAFVDEFYATHDWCDEPTRADMAPLVVLEDGSMDTVLTIRLEMQEPGMPMPPLYGDFGAWFGGTPGVRHLGTRFVATGTGTFTEHAATYGFTPDTTGKVVINQQWVTGPLMRTEHAAPGLEMQGEFPAEVIRVQQMPS